MAIEILTQLQELTGLNKGVLIFIIIWTLVWKGFALWKSAKKNQLVWFIIFLVVNTLGILEILYIFLFSKLDFNLKPIKSKKSSKRKTQKKNNAIK